MKFSVLIDDVPIWDYTVNELVAMMYRKEFSCDEVAIIDSIVTCKIEGGEE